MAVPTEERTYTDMERAALIRLGALTAYMEGLAAAMFELGVFTEWAEDLTKEAKKTDELVEMWSSL